MIAKVPTLHPRLANRMAPTEHIEMLWVRMKEKVIHKIDSAHRMRVDCNPDDEDILDEYEAWRETMKAMRTKAV